MNGSCDLMDFKSERVVMLVNESCCLGLVLIVCTFIIVVFRFFVRVAVIGSIGGAAECDSHD